MGGRHRTAISTRVTQIIEARCVSCAGRDSSGDATCWSYRYMGAVNSTAPARLPSSLATPRALGRFIAIVVPPTLRGLASCSVVRSTNYSALDVDRSAGRTAFVARRAQRSSSSLRIWRFARWFLFPKLRIVEDFPSWAVIVFDVASDDSDLGVGWAQPSQLQSRMQLLSTSICPPTDMVKK